MHKENVSLYDVSELTAISSGRTPVHDSIDALNRHVTLHVGKRQRVSSR